MASKPLSYILTIDQGTSGTKVIIFDADGNLIHKGHAPLETKYAESGFVEQDPYAIIESVRLACAECISEVDVELISGIAISNQRETFLLWDNKGIPVTPAIVWSDKRSISVCQSIKEQADWVKSKTGLPMDPYFSATKLLWCVQQDKGLQNRIENGEIYFGTVDTWLLYQLTNGQSYATDYTNASRTMLFNIYHGKWDNEILEKWNLKELHLPVVQFSASTFGSTNLFGLLKSEVQIASMMGDSHASLFGEACFGLGDTKMTLGTGCSLLMNIGSSPKTSKNGLVTTVGYSSKNSIVYAWEGAIVSCGSMMEWLQNQMHLIKDVTTSSEMAFNVQNSNIFLVPAFSGLGSPFWKMEAKASIHGIDFGTKPEHIICATLESICFQIKAVVDAMEEDLGQSIQQIAIHGGLSKNEFVQAVLTNLINASLMAQSQVDISSLGTAFMAMLQLNIYTSEIEIKNVLKTYILERVSLNEDVNLKYNEWKKLINNIK